VIQVLLATLSFQPLTVASGKECLFEILRATVIFFSVAMIAHLPLSQGTFFHLNLGNDSINFGIQNDFLDFKQETFEGWSSHTSEVKTLNSVQVL
jgi:hypothetical protein